MSIQLRNIQHLYSLFVNPKLLYPPVVAVYRIIDASTKSIRFDAIPIGIWLPEAGIIVKQLPEWEWKKPNIKRLSALELQEDGYATDGIRTYYINPEVPYAMIGCRP